MMLSITLSENKISWIATPLDTHSKFKL